MLIVLRDISGIYPDCLMSSLQRIALLEKRLLKVLCYISNVCPTIDENNRLWNQHRSKYAARQVDRLIDYEE